MRRNEKWRQRVEGGFQATAQYIHEMHSSCLTHPYTELIQLTFKRPMYDDRCIEYNAEIYCFPDIS